MEPHQNHVYKLLGAEPSPFTAKIRAYLKWKQIPFTEAIASEKVYKDIILPYTKVSFMPVLLAYDGTVLETASKSGVLEPSPLFAIQDTKAIMDYFEKMNRVPNLSCARNSMMHPLLPTSAQLAFAGMIFELLGDEWLINQAIYWRWGKGNFEQQHKFLAFDYGSFGTGGMSSFEETSKNGEKKLPRLRQVLPLLGVSDHTGPYFRSQFKNLLELMSAHLGDYPFLLGWRISLADFAFFGSFYAHLVRDPVPSFIIKTEAPLVFEWVERVGGLSRWAGLGTDRWDSSKTQWKASYGESKSGVQQPYDERSAVPASSTKVAELLLSDYILVLQDTLTRTLQYLQEVNNESHRKYNGINTVKLPRTLGRHAFRIGSATGEVAMGERSVYTHSIWMLDRIVERSYNSRRQQTLSDEWLKTFDSQEIYHIWRNCVALWSATGWKIGRSENKLLARKYVMEEKPKL